MFLLTFCYVLGTYWNENQILWSYLCSYLFDCPEWQAWFLWLGICTVRGWLRRSFWRIKANCLQKVQQLSCLDRDQEIQGQCKMVPGFHFCFLHLYVVLRYQALMNVGAEHTGIMQDMIQLSLSMDHFIPVKERFLFPVLMIFPQNFPFEGMQWLSSSKGWRWMGWTIFRTSLFRNISEGKYLI